MNEHCMREPWWCKARCKHLRWRSLHRVQGEQVSDPCSPPATPAGQASSLQSQTLCVPSWWWGPERWFVFIKIFRSQQGQQLPLYDFWLAKRSNFHIILWQFRDSAMKIIDCWSPSFIYNRYKICLHTESCWSPLSFKAICSSHHNILYYYFSYFSLNPCLLRMQFSRPFLQYLLFNL